VLPPDVRAREAASYLPLERKRSGYYKEINSNHFNAATAVGSLFTNAASLGKLLDTCILQRHSLSGDDREELIALGADAAAFAKVYAT
jgi:hypothetical protein